METQREESQEKKVQNTESNQPVKTESNADNTQNTSTQNKVSKPKKIVYLNQKVYFPVNIPDKIEYIRNLFYHDELGYIINNAPLYKSSKIADMGKYFKLKLKYILEIASGILFYLFKHFKINNKPEEEKRTTEEILNSGEINSYIEMCELYQDLCNNSGVKIYDHLIDFLS